MKIYDYVLVLCILILAVLAVWFIRNTPTVKKEKTDVIAVNTETTSIQQAPYTFGMGISTSTGEAESVELMPLFSKDDSLESMSERGWILYHALIKDYEKYLIRKYAPLNLTDDEILQRQKDYNKYFVMKYTRFTPPDDEMLEWQKAFDRIRGTTLESSEDIRREQYELNDFGSVWGRIKREGSPDPRAHLRLGPPRIPETLWGLEKEGIFLRFKDAMASTLNHERFKKQQDAKYEMPEEEKSKAKFNDKQIELLNQFIVTHKIPAKSPGLPFSYSLQLSDEDRAFIEDAVKSNPAIKLPWRD